MAKVTYAHRDRAGAVFQPVAVAMNGGDYRGAEDLIAQAIADAVEEFRQNGAYCIDCGNAMDDWRGHGDECVYRQEDEPDPRLALAAEVERTRREMIAATVAEMRPEKS
jgi:hypothetical protein